MNFKSSKKKGRSIFSEREKKNRRKSVMKGKGCKRGGLVDSGKRKKDMGKEVRKGGEGSFHFVDVSLKLLRFDGHRIWACPRMPPKRK